MIDSIEKYRIFDLIILSILAVVAEIVGNLLHIELPGAGYHLSFAILIAIIALIRWGIAGAIVYIIAGIAMVFIGAGTLTENILLYPMAYAFVAIAALFFHFTDRHKLKDNTFLLLLFSIVVHLSVSVGKGLAMFVLTGDFLEGFIYFNITQLFSIVIMSIALLVIKGKSGLLVDMRRHLIEMKSEQNTMEETG